MTLKLEEVRKAVETPDLIKCEGNDRIYYRQSTDEYQNIYMKVAVKLQANPYNTDGFVASAYTIRDKETRGEIEWQKS